MSVINIAIDEGYSRLSPCAKQPILAGSCMSAAQFVHSYRHWFEDAKRDKIQQAHDLEQWLDLACAASKFSWQEKQGTVDKPNMYWQVIVVPLQRRAILERALDDHEFCQLLEQTEDSQLIFDNGIEILNEEKMGWGKQLMIFRTFMQTVNLDKVRKWKRPPYIEMPHIARGSIGWRMGGGESYATDFRDWYAGLQEAEKAEYAPYLEWGRRV